MAVRKIKLPDGTTQEINDYRISDDDLYSFVRNTISVTGTGYLTGGGDLTANRTIDLASTYKTRISHGETAYGWGNHADAGYVGTLTNGSGTYVKSLSKSGGTLTATYGTEVFMSIAGATEIPENADLNSYTTPGNYYVRNATIAATISDLPAAVPAVLFVERAISTSSNYLRQRFRPYSNTYEYVRRTRDGGASWGSWYVSYNSENLTKSVVTGLIGSTTYAPYNAAGYLPLSGGTMTGAIVVPYSTILRIADSTFDSSGRAVLTASGTSTATAVVTFGANVGTTKIRGGSNTDLYHTKSSTDYKIWDAGNSNLATVDWAAKNLTTAGTLSVNGLATLSGGAFIPAGKELMVGEGKILWGFSGGDTLTLLADAQSASIGDGATRISLAKQGGIAVDSNGSIIVNVYNGEDIFLHSDLEVSGDITAQSDIYVGGQIYQSSDETLKSNIRSIELPIRLIAEAPCISYLLREGNIRQIGTTAQYWKDVLPESVSVDKNNNLGLVYGNVALVSVIKVAQEVVSHEERIKALEEKVALLN